MTTVFLAVTGFNAISLVHLFLLLLNVPINVSWMALIKYFLRNLLELLQWEILQVTEHLLLLLLFMSAETTSSTLEHILMHAVPTEDVLLLTFVTNLW